MGIFNTSTVAVVFRFSLLPSFSYKGRNEDEEGHFKKDSSTYIVLMSS